MLATAIGSWLLSCVPVQAQVWGYSPYSGSATWLSLARTLSYPLNRISGAYTPWYLANNLLYSASYAANQGFFGRGRNLNYGVYTDQEPYGDPRQGTRQYLSSNGSVADQMVHARWSKSQQQYADDDIDDVPVPPTSTQQTWLNNPMVTPQTVPTANSESMPPVAPPIAWSPRSSSPDSPPKVSEPLGQGFIQVVNERFGGDIALALRDKDLRKYARSVGLIDSDKVAADKMPQEKLDLIRAILADRSESASTKINAVRVLLKH